MAVFVTCWVLALELNQSNLDSLHHPKEEEDDQEYDEGGPAWHGLSHEALYSCALEVSLKEPIHQKHLSPKNWFIMLVMRHAKSCCMPYMPSRNSFSAPK